MARKAKLDWIQSGALNDLVEHRKKGGSLSDFLYILRDKYGVSYTPARVSQVLKSIRDTEALNLKELN